MAPKVNYFYVIKNTHNNKTFIGHTTMSNLQKVLHNHWHNANRAAPEERTQYFKDIIEFGRNAWTIEEQFKYEDDNSVRTSNMFCKYCDALRKQGEDLYNINERPQYMFNWL